MKQCDYCGKQIINYPYYEIQEIRKPPNQPNRRVTVGVCCEICHEVHGKPVVIDKGSGENE